MCEDRAVAIYRIQQEDALRAPALIVSLDGWVDAGSAGTTAAEFIAAGGTVVATFDGDALIDYRARRPTLHVQDGVLTEMEWPELTVRRVQADERDLLVLTGPEPDYRWNAFRGALVELSLRLGVVESVSLGAIPATVPHSRPTPIMVTGRDRRALVGDVELPGFEMQVPAAAVNLVEVALAEHGIPSVGIWAQVPHYVVGTYHGAALALVERAMEHLGVQISTDRLVEEAMAERVRLDNIVAERPDAQAYLEQLEAAGPIPSITPDEDIASEVEQFLRDRTGEDPGA